ncbi:MAG: SpoIVB peptidase [Ruminiclostridium sp.]|nr:SpoIVB peptidase [Ruminiclostridium sp.]
MKIKPLYITAAVIAAVSAVISVNTDGNADAAQCLSLPRETFYEERRTLIPCGTPFGIKMLTDGVIVTDFGTVNGNYDCVSPAEKAGIKKGDIITSINEIPVNDSISLSNAVQAAGGECTIEIVRDEEIFSLAANPVKSESDGLYKLGLWTRDSCAGIGTMTFYDPENEIFGGLGHSVSDISTGLTLPLLEGEITAVTITDIMKGSAGMPGELCGAFISDTETGTVEINSDYGVFGYSDCTPVLNEPMEIAHDEEIKKGKATIYTTVSGMMPAEYEIEIEKIDYGSKSPSRNMTIRITDSDLLSLTGGIVQGMSGSPIIQDGRIIGAVTHVLVNDSARGYGIFIENMCGVSEQLEIN